MCRHARRHSRERAPAPRLGTEGGERLTGTLYVVATPIGNLEDVTLRALRVLREVAVIAAEDTRHTRILLTRHGITTPVVSYFEHNKLRRGPALVARLRAGEAVALVTDAGTPGISDPGFHLARLARDAGVPVVPVPGPAAVTAALSAAGVPADRFVFEGFLPVKPGRRRGRLQELAALARPIVLYESPHRLAATLAAVAEVFPDTEVVVARELTKQFEEFRCGTAAELIAALPAAGVRGEITLVVNVRPRAARPAGPERRCYTQATASPAAPEPPEPEGRHSRGPERRA